MRFRNRLLGLLPALTLFVGLLTAPARAQTYTYTVLHDFFGGFDGDGPKSHLIRDSAGILYGTTTNEFSSELLYETPYNMGTVFKLDPATNRLTTLHQFSGPDGANPEGGLVLDANGFLYGTTANGGRYGPNGGINGYGTIFKMDTSGGQFQTLHSFSGTDGFQPMSGLLLDDQGNLYGMTEGGGADGWIAGVVFSLSPGSILPSYVNVNVANVAAAGGQTVPLYAVLRHPADDTLLAGRNLQFYLNNAFVGTAVTNSNGTASVSYTVPESSLLGAQTIKVVRLADSQYDASVGYATLQVSAADTSVTVSNASGAIGQTVTLSATLTRTTDNSPLPGRSLSFYVNSAYVGTANTDNTGTAQVSYKVPDNSAPGAQTITVKRLANSQYNGSTGTGTLTVTAADTSVSVANVSGTAGQAVMLRAVLTRTSDNAVLPGRSLSFYVNNAYVGTANTDSAGTAQVSYLIPSNLSAGAQQTITVKRLANSQYNAGQGTGTLTVAP